MCDLSPVTTVLGAKFVRGQSSGVVAAAAAPKSFPRVNSVSVLRTIVRCCFESALVVSITALKREQHCDGSAFRWL